MIKSIGRYTAEQIVAWWCRPHDTTDQAARARMAIVLAAAALRFAARRMSDRRVARLEQIQTELRDLMLEKADAADAGGGA